MTPHQPSPTHPQVTSIAELYHPVQELAGYCRYFSCNLVIIVLENPLYLILMGVAQASLWWAVPECTVVLPQPLEESKPQMGTLYSLPCLLPHPRTQQTQTSAHSQTCTWNSGTGVTAWAARRTSRSFGGYSLLVLMSRMTSAWASPTYHLVYEKNSSVSLCIAEHYSRVSL